ncbi:MAG: amidase domain-containing protein [Eubacteriales bacterium]
MLVIKPYHRDHAAEYAARRSLTRNPLYAGEAERGEGGANFVSQCLYAGSCTMNFTPVLGWYYLSESAYTDSWVRVETLYRFLLCNGGPGPFGRRAAMEELAVGDVIFLGRNGEGYFQAVLVVGDEGEAPLVATHGEDVFSVPLDRYRYDYAGLVRIEGVRQRLPAMQDCFHSFLEGIAIIPE